MIPKPVLLPLAVYTTVSVLYSVFSYSLTDPNLVLSSHPWYWQFQQEMWRIFFGNAPLLTQTFTILSVLFFGSYAWLASSISKQKRLNLRLALMLLLIACVPLLFSYNALSHDVFNYAFNAKMLVAYGQDPHQTVALEFPNDPWVRFMHNTHTAAPYGYGWTLLSVLPFFLGMGKFILTWLSFRVFAILSVALLIFGLLHAQKHVQAQRFWVLLVLLLLNPLFLIEVVSNMHNDLWMIAPAIISLSLVAHSSMKRHIILISLALLTFSASIKFATVLLVPLWLMLAAFPWILKRLTPYQTELLEKVRANWPLVASVLLFLPLLTTRSQLFHPWYLLWSLAWIPLISHRWWKVILLSFSLSSLLRYLPWLWAGNFEGSVLTYQQLITWVFTAVLVGVYFWISAARSTKVLE